MDEQEASVKITRIVSIGLACVAFALISGMTTCTMYDNKLESGKQSARTAHLKVQTEQDKIRSESIKELIDSGVSPVAARCAIIGWETEREAIVCAVSGANSNIPLDNIKK